MIAYFALLSFVPLLFLALALLGLVHQADEGSFFVRELSKTFPSTSLDSILRAVRGIQANATTLGIVGGAFLLWSSLSFFSVLESAFNIVYDKPNRGWLHGKALATMMMVGSLVALFASLVVGSIGREVLKRYAGFSGDPFSAQVIAVIVSTVVRQGVPPQATYLFKHALVQDAAYGTLLREPRRALHARIAETLESQFAEIAENQPEVLGRHFTEAGMSETAIRYWSKAGERARPTPKQPRI